MIVSPIISDFRHEIVISILASIFLGAVAMPFRKVKSAWLDLTTKLEAVHIELSVQRNNCLQTLQNQGDKQIELLGKAVDTLGEMRLEAKETQGFLKGIFQK
jgi:hypothetical protein